MEELLNRRRGPFTVVAALFVAICIVVIAIPDSVLALLANNRPLTLAQAGWAYRILAFFAIGQVVYTGMSVFRIERLDALREKDDRFARLSKPAVISSLSRNAAALVFFTLVYGIASLILTAQRGGFWLFPALAVAQGAWYYREIGQVARWKAFQPETSGDASMSTAWSAGGRDYCPPLARGLRPLEGAAKTGD